MSYQSSYQNIVTSRFFVDKESIPFHHDLIEKLKLRDPEFFSKGETSMKTTTVVLFLVLSMAGMILIVTIYICFAIHIYFKVLRQRLAEEA